MFFLRPHRALLAEDGVRSGLEWEDVLRIDGMVKLLLEMFGIPYIPVESLAMQERVRLVERVLELSGVEPLGEDSKEFELSAGGPAESVQAGAMPPRRSPGSTPRRVPYPTN